MADVLAATRAPRRSTHGPIVAALNHVLFRTEKRANVPMRKLHDSIRSHFEEIVGLGEHRPPTGRIEALNTSWESLVRRARGYRDHEYLFRKLRFITALLLTNDEVERSFVAYLVEDCIDAIECSLRTEISLG